MSFSPGRARLVTGHYDGMTKPWDPGTGQELSSLGGCVGAVFGLEFSPGGERLTASAGRSADLLARCASLSVSFARGNNWK